MYVIMGYGKHQDMLKPYHEVMACNSLDEAKTELEWQKKHNSYAEWKIYKLQEVE